MPAGGNSTNPAGGEETESGLNTEISVPLALLLSAIAIFTITENCATVYVFATDFKLQSFAHRLILNLACADGLVGLTSMTVRVYTTLTGGGHFWTRASCVTFMTLDMWFNYTAGASILVVSINHFLSVLRKTRWEKQQTPQMLHKMIAAPWVIIFVCYCLPVILWYPVFGDDGSIAPGTCSVPPYSNWPVVAVIFLVLPFCFIWAVPLFDVLIYYQIRKQFFEKIEATIETEETYSGKSEAGNDVFKRKSVTKSMLVNEFRRLSMTAIEDRPQEVRRLSQAINLKRLSDVNRHVDLITSLQLAMAEHKSQTEHFQLLGYEKVNRTTKFLAVDDDDNSSLSKTEMENGADGEANLNTRGAGSTAMKVALDAGTNKKVSFGKLNANQTQNNSAQNPKSRKTAQGYPSTKNNFADGPAQGRRQQSKPYTNMSDIVVVAVNTNNNADVEVDTDFSDVIRCVKQENGGSIALPDALPGSSSYTYKDSLSTLPGADDSANTNTNTNTKVAPAKNEGDSCVDVPKIHTVQPAQADKPAINIPHKMVPSGIDGGLSKSNKSLQYLRSTDVKSSPQELKEKKMRDLRPMASLVSPMDDESWGEATIDALMTYADEMKEARVAFLLGIFLVCCSTPFESLKLISSLCKLFPRSACLGHVPPAVMDLSLWVVLLNSTANPIIFFAADHNYYAALRRFLARFGFVASEDDV